MYPLDFPYSSGTKAVPGDRSTSPCQAPGSERAGNSDPEICSRVVFVGANNSIEQTCLIPREMPPQNPTSPYPAHMTF